MSFRLVIKIFYICIFVMLSYIMLSCHKVTSDSRRLMAHEIYLKNINLLNQYSDSILAAKDTLTVNHILTRYDEVLAKLYFSYPPEIDIDMTEAENDTLAQFTLKLLELKNKRLYKLGNPIVTEEDSTLLSN